MYAIAFGGHQSPGELKRYLEKPKTDPTAAEFHQRVSDGFSAEQILNADIVWFVQYFLMSRTGIIDFRNDPHGAHRFHQLNPER